MSQPLRKESLLQTVDTLQLQDPVIALGVKIHFLSPRVRKTQYGVSFNSGSPEGKSKKKKNKKRKANRRKLKLNS